MTVKSKPKTRREKFREWREERKYGVEVTPSNLRKYENLESILRKDMDKLGIKQVAVLVRPKNWGPASAHRQVYRVKGKEKREYPTMIIFDYKYVHNLNVQELRSIAWHEMGHYIFRYYYPEIANNTHRSKEYVIAEAFANEFAYRKFGNVYLSAIRKEGVALGMSKTMRKKFINEIKDIKKHVEKYGYGYWKEVAKKKNIDVKYDPKKSIIMGVKPKAGILGNLR